MLDWRDTIVGPATGVGDGCRAIVRIAGPISHELVSADAANGPATPWKKPLSYDSEYRLETINRNLPVKVFGWPEGRSSTGQPMAELHMANSPAIVGLVVDQLIHRGGRLARPGEFTLRSFLAGRLDLAEAEGVLGVIESNDFSTLKLAVDQRSGGLSKPVTQLRSDLLDTLADVEANLDFVEEDIQFLSHDQLAERLENHRHRLHEMIQTYSGRTLSGHRPRIVILGPPNAGKSSLFNRLVRDQSAIVSSVSGTTRDFLQGTTTIAGVEVEVIDTAGWNPDAESHQAIDRQAAEGRSSVETLADIRLYCVPVGTPAPVDLNVPHPSFLIRTLADLQNNPDDGRFDAAVSVKGDPGIQQLLDLLERNLLALRTGVKAAMSGRCLTSLMQACDSLDATLEHARQGASMEIMALGIRETLSPLGEIVGAVYTNDLLDRIFSRFCIGK